MDKIQEIKVKYDDEVSKKIGKLVKLSENLVDIKVT